MLFLQLFLTFFKIGLFGFGGGYAMLSMIQGEVVSGHAWISMSQFTDIVAVSQMTPGPIGINSATYVGYTAVTTAGYSAWLGVVGSALATFAVVLPSFLLMLLVAKLFQKYRHSAGVDNMFNQLRPTIVGLLAAAALLLMTPENFASPNTDGWQFGCSLFIFLATLYGTQVSRISPIRMIIFSAIAGLFLYYF